MCIRDRSSCCALRARGPRHWLCLEQLVRGAASVENGTTILFGLPGVAVDRIEKDAEGARTVHLRTADEAAAACPRCGGVLEFGQAASLHPAEGLAVRGGAACGAVAQD